RPVTRRPRARNPGGPTRGGATPRADAGSPPPPAGEHLRYMSEPPLGAFAQFALEPAPLFVRCLDDPAPRRLHLLDSRAYLSLKPGVRHHEPGRRADRCQ